MRGGLREVGEKNEGPASGGENGGAGEPARYRGRAKECGKRRIRATTRVQNTDV